MRRLTILIALAGLAAACGTVEQTVEGAAPDSGPAAGVVVASAGVRGTELPSGLASADGSTYVALAAGRLVRFDPVTGERRGSMPVLGAWRLAAVSANGRWAALEQGRTRVLVLDVRRGSVAHELDLDGDFLVETVANDGSFLFLQQNFADGRYAVRGYSLRTGKLLPGSLATKGQTVKMAGTATGTIASPDGRWLLTVYVDTAKGTAFVHALNIADRLPICIDLPPCVDCDLDDLRGWKLTLGSDGRTLAARNAAGRTAAEIDLATTSVVRTSTF